MSMQMEDLKAYLAAMRIAAKFGISPEDVEELVINHAYTLIKNQWLASQNKE